MAPVLNELCCSIVFLITLHCWIYKMGYGMVYETMQFMMMIHLMLSQEYSINGFNGSRGLWTRL